MTAMLNIYYRHSINRGPGILRAVLSREEARSLLKHLSVHYVGQRFPTAAQDQTGDVAIIRILDEELGEEWHAGFYCFDGDIMRVEDAIQASTTNLPHVRSIVNYLAEPNHHNCL
jgi:hypothetical protein